jgi:hypothetical protein
MIIGIGGEKGSGKDTAAQVLIDKHGFTRTAFADPLKQLISKALGIDLLYFYDRHLKDKDFDQPRIISIKEIRNICDLCGASPTVFKELCMFNWSANSPRELMQIIGTEMVRNFVDHLYWVKQTMKQVNNGKRWVITDMRMSNERQAVAQLGGSLLRIINPSIEKTDQHKSETDLGSIDEYDQVVYNDSTIAVLHARVEGLLWDYQQV